MSIYNSYSLYTLTHILLCMQNEEIESIIKKISTEIDTVRNHVSDAKYNIQIGNITLALKHLKEAKETSTCSYCQNKIQEAIFDLEHNLNICNIGSKSCESDKEQIVNNLTDFYNKLPNIEEIRKNKAVSQEQPFDPIGSIFYTANEISKSLNSVWTSMWKWS